MVFWQKFLYNSRRVRVVPVDSTGNHVSAVGTNGFDAQMSTVKFWKGDENLALRTDYKKIEWLLVFLDFLVRSKYTLTFLGDETFCF